MKRKIVGIMLTVAMLSGLVGCGDNKGEKKDVKSTEVVSTETSETNLGTETEDSTEEETSNYGKDSKALDYKDKVTEKTLTDKGWTQLSSNGISFYAPSECNTYTKTNGNSSLCIVGLNEDLYNDVDEKTTAVYGATDFYAICVIDASESFKSDKEEDKDKKDTTETEEDTRTVIKNGVFTKGETEDLVSVVLNDKDVKTNVMVDTDDLVIYQLDNSSAYLGFMYGTTNIVEVIFDPAAYDDIYKITPSKGTISSEDDENTENTEATENKEDSSDKTDTEDKEQKLTEIKGRDGYLSAQYLEAYKSELPDSKVGDIVYKAGHFLDDETEAALIVTMTKASKEVKN